MEAHPERMGSDGAAWRGVVDAELLTPALLHELRQPLTGAEAAVLLLERSLGPALAAREEWTLLKQQLARVAEVMSGYDELFHAAEATEAVFEIGPTVARAVQLLAHRVRPLGRRFALLPAAGPVRGFGSAAALVHVTTNLLGNALDAVEDVPEARVAVRVLSAAGGAQVRISDEGPGIPAPVRARLFEPRFSTKPPERGSGLGLHLSRVLMARFGGEVFLVREEDPARLPWAATEFCVTVPAPPTGEPT